MPVAGAGAHSLGRSVLTTAAAPASEAPASIDPTGSSDVTSSLQAFLDSAPDHSRISFPAGARYRVEGTLRLVDRHGLELDGRGALVFATTRGDRTRSQWRIEGGSGLVVHDLQVRGANPSGGTGEAAYRAGQEAQHGFDVVGVQGLALERVTVTDVYGDFVYLGARRVERASGDTEKVWTSGVRITDSTFRRNGRQGVAVVAAEDVVIQGNDIADTRRATFDIEPNGPRDGARNIRILDNRIGAGRLLFVAMGGVGGRIDGIEIAGNHLDRPFTMTVSSNDGVRRANIVVRDNVATRPFGSDRAAITVVDVDGVTIERNDLRFDERRQMVAVRLVRCTGAQVRDNQFRGAVADLEQVNPGPAAPPSPASTGPGTPQDSPPLAVERLAGGSRIATAVAISQRTFPDGAPIALLARADAYPDALAGSPLATAYAGPLLLNPADGLDPAVVAELDRLGAREVVLLGGDSAISPAVADALTGLGVAVSRIGGATRFETALHISQALARVRPYDEVVVVEGAHPSLDRGFPDALTAAGLAAAQGLPILLVTQSDLPTETAAALRPDIDVVVVGGDSAVSPAVEAQVATRSRTVRRVAGATRYATSAALLAEAESRGMDTSTLYLATGVSFPDALVAGAAAGTSGTVVVLVDPTDLDASPEGRLALESRAGEIETLLIVGGEAAVGRRVEDQVRQAAV